MAEQVACGLRVVEDRQTVAASIPLLGVDVTAEVRQSASRVTVKQRYRNDETHPVEAVYVFPLDEAAAVCGFEAWVGEQHVVGRVEERDRAFEVYDDALSAGHGAFLLDQERPNVFTASVGNLLPGQEVTLVLRYVAELAREGDRLRFLLPTTVSPRYVSQAERDRPQVGEPDYERVTPPVAGTVPYGLSFRADVVLGGPIAGVASPSHPLEVRIDGGRAEVTLAQRETAMDRDLVLLIAPAEAARPTALVQVEDDGTRTAMVTFLPEFGGEARPSEVVFVVDCSGSMEGSSIEEARGALRLCLRQLSSGDRFNVVRFGSTFASLWERSRPYDESSLRQADGWVAATTASLGGTEILAPLQHILGQKVASECQRQVVLLTDGQVSNEPAVIGLAGTHKADTRIFSFGIGAGCSAHLVRGVARVSGGAAEFIGPGEHIEAKVLRQFARLTAPPVEDVRIDAGRGAQVAPEAIGSVYDGEALTLYARLGDGAETVSLKARQDGRELSFDVSLPQAESGTLVATLFARTAIREYDEEGHTLAAGGSQQSGRRAEALKGRIKDLALRYGLVSSQTSYVAVEERAEADSADQPAELRRVPVALTSGWGGLAMQATTGAVPPMPMAAMAPPMARARFGVAGGAGPQSAALGFTSQAGGGAWTPDAYQTLGADDDDLFAPVRGGLGLLPGSSQGYDLSAMADQAESPVTDLSRVLMSQGAAGSFGGLADVASMLGLGDELYDSLVAALGEEVTATLLALRLLHIRFAGDEAQWRRAARKAQKWLSGAAKLDRKRIGGLAAREWFEAALRDAGIS